MSQNDFAFKRDEDELEKRIDSAFLAFCTAASPNARRRAYDKMLALKQRRSPNDVIRLDHALLQTACHE